MKEKLNGSHSVVGVIFNQFKRFITSLTAFSRLQPLPFVLDIYSNITLY